ncbi:MAG: alpha/beta fold hydrolase [Polyangiaceae bacterium]
MTDFDELIDLPRGRRVRVRARGEGPTLLWCHGVFFPIEVDDESALGRVLNEVPGLRVVRLDARGHGRTPAGPDGAAHRWDAMAEDVLDVATALGARRFALGGISMGAAVALHAALSAPERVEAMLLFALPTAWETRGPEKVRYRELFALGSTEAMVRHVERDLDALFPDRARPPALEAMVRAIGRSPWEALARVIEGAAESDMPDRSALAGLDVPVLVRPWPDDSGHPMSSAEALAKALPRGDLSVLASFDDDPGMRAAFAELGRLLAAR